MTAPNMTWSNGLLHPLRHALGRMAQGLLAITHNSMALLGLTLAFTAVVFMTQPQLRDDLEKQLFGWLMERQMASDEVPVDPTVVDRVTATNPSELPKEQAQVAKWLSDKYRVAREPISALVAEAYDLGARTRLDPKLILAVVAIESRFNPFAASPVGAQGLMQVMTRVHTDKYEDFGGSLAAFDPVTNLRVGAQVLQETIRRAGSIEGGLRLYVGAVNNDGNDYVAKVQSEHERLKRVAKGQRVGFDAFQVRPMTSTAAAQPATGPTTENAAALEAEASHRTAERNAQAS